MWSRISVEPGAGWPVRLLGDPRWTETWLRLRNPVRAPLAPLADWIRAAYVYRLVRQSRPAFAVETGVHFGKTTATILYALERNRQGRLLSIDLPSAAPKLNADGKLAWAHVRSAGETGFLVPKELRGRWQLELGDARVLLPSLLSGQEIDFFLHDSDHSFAHQSFEYAFAWSVLRPGGVLASDDTGFSAAWKTFLESHAGQFTPLPSGPMGLKAIRKVAG